MIKPIMTNEIFLARPSEPATAADAQTAQDLLDTLAAHAHECVGMAANMIGVPKRIIVFDDEGTHRIMYNPEIVSSAGAYDAEEGCLSLIGRRPRHALPHHQGVLRGRRFSRENENVHGLDRADHPARDRPHKRDRHLGGIGSPRHMPTFNLLAVESKHTW